MSKRAAENQLNQLNYDKVEDDVCHFFYCTPNIAHLVYRTTRGKASRSQTRPPSLNESAHTHSTALSPYSFVFRIKGLPRRMARSLAPEPSPTISAVAETVRPPLHYCLPCSDQLVSTCSQLHRLRRNPAHSQVSQVSAHRALRLLAPALLHLQLLAPSNLPLQISPLSLAPLLLHPSHRQHRTLPRRSPLSYRHLHLHLRLLYRQQPPHRSL